MQFIHRIHPTAFNTKSTTLLKIQRTAMSSLFPTIQFSGSASHMYKSFLIHRKINL